MYLNILFYKSTNNLLFLKQYGAIIIIKSNGMLWPLDFKSVFVYFKSTYFSVLLKLQHLANSVHTFGKIFIQISLKTKCNIKHKVVYKYLQIKYKII